MAVEMAPAVLHLTDVATGRTVAKLKDPHNDRATWQGFTPDGTQLVVVASHASAIHIWDLRAIRTRLLGMSLDWDWPSFPPAATANAPAEPVTIKVIPADKSMVSLTREQKAQRAIERYRREFGAKPDSAASCNNLAWVLLAAPEPLRDVKAALPLAEKAARLAPEDVSIRNTLGLAYYRAGRYREAADVLRPNLADQTFGLLGYELYFLAMSYHRLGETTRARDYYELAIRWGDGTGRLPEARSNLDAVFPEELAAFRAEAQELLGIGRPAASAEQNALELSSPPN
jgi:hypothetical protein